MLAHVAGSTEDWKAVVCGRRVFQTVARRNLSDEERVSRISPGDFHGLRTEENPLYPSDLRISVRLGQYSSLRFIHSPTCARVGYAHISVQFNFVYIVFYIVCTYIYICIYIYLCVYFMLCTCVSSKINNFIY